MEAQARKQRTITSEKVDPTKPATIVINKFGGLTRFCDLTGFATSTAHGWTVSGYIPPRHHATILRIAAENGVAIEPGDFVEKPANDQISPAPDGDSAAAGQSPGQPTPTSPVAAHPGALVNGQ